MWGIHLARCRTRQRTAASQVPTTQADAAPKDLTEEGAASFHDLFAEAGALPEPETEDGGDWWGAHDEAGGPAGGTPGGPPGGRAAANGSRLHGGGRADQDARHLIDGDGFDHDHVASWHDRCGKDLIASRAHAHGLCTAMQHMASWPALFGLEFVYSWVQCCESMCLLMHACQRFGPWALRSVLSRLLPCVPWCPRHATHVPPHPKCSLEACRPTARAPVSIAFITLLTHRRVRDGCRYIHNYEDYLANEEAQVPPWEDEWRSELWGDEAHLEAPHRKEVITVIVTHFPVLREHIMLGCSRICAACMQCLLAPQCIIQVPAAHNMQLCSVLGRRWPANPSPWLTAGSS